MGSVFALSVGWGGGAREGVLQSMSKLAKLCVAGMMSGAILAASTTVAAESVLDTGPDGEETLPAGMAPPGLRLENVVFFPRLDASVTYTDNVSRTERDQEEDLIFQAGTVAPSILLRSAMPLHEYFVEGRLIAPVHTRHSADTRIGGSIRAGGSLELTPRSALSGSASYTLTHEERGAPDLPADAKEPTRVQIFRVAPQYDHRFRHLAFRLSGQYRRLDYQDTPRIAAPETTLPPIPSSSRDRDEWSGMLRVMYPLSPLHLGFVEGGLSRRVYATSNGPAGLNRNSTGWQTLVGLTADLSPTMRSEMAVGIGHREYDDGRLSSTTGPRARGRLLWDVGPLTRLKGRVSVSHEETTLAQSSGSLTSSLDLGLAHQVARQTLVEVDGYYRTRDYRGIGREDHDFGGVVGASYWLNPRVSVGANYGHHRRASSGAQRGERFSENRATVRMTIRR